MATNKPISETPPQPPVPMGKGRGASYPSLTLREAVGKLKKFWVEEKKAAVPVSSAVKHWGYGEKSSGGRQAVSTLLQYGLLRDQGSGDQRRLSVSELGLDILLHEEGTAEHVAALRQAAKAPKLFTAILAHYNNALPSDATLSHYLVKEKDVHADTVRVVIKNLRDSTSYANLLSSDATPPKDSSLEEPSGGQKKQPQVGDHVQWESDGMLKLDAPRRLRAIQNSEGVSWGFVDGSETGIPMAELLLDAPAVTQTKPPPTPPLLPDERLPIEREWLRGPLAKNVSYRLIVSGDLGPRELGKLIKLLEAQKLVLLDDEGDDR